MSLISEALWHDAFLKRPMPENCTYEQFASARDQLWIDEAKEEDIETIKEFSALQGNNGFMEFKKQEYEKAIERVMYG